MSISKQIISSRARLVLFSGGIIFLLSGCRKDTPSIQFGTTSPKASTEQSTQFERGDFGEQEQAYQKTKDEALADAEKSYEARSHDATLPPSYFRFPNTPEPEQSVPDYLNFYRINDHYPTYLLCEYDVKEEKYNQSDEADWFKTALKQIRQSGPMKFPPLNWIAVIIINRAEWTGGSTFEQAHKVGAIFRASDVFSPSCDLSQLVAHADMDRHPFKYDTTQPTPGDQQRWLIVEQHAATNGASAEPK